MRKQLILFSMVAAIVLGFSFTERTQDVKQQLQNLSGRYADPVPYNYGKAWGKREFTFQNGRWTLLFTLGLDPEMKMQVFTFRTKGTYKVLDESKVAANIYNAVFYEDRKWVTLKTSEESLINAFGFGPCEMVKDIEKDISITGCSVWKSVAECPADFDLLSLDKEGRLYFGERPADNNMCSPEKRPQRLTPPVIKM